LLVPPTPELVAEFQAESAAAIKFAREKDLLLAGGWGVGADLIGWVYGLQRLPYAVFDHPDFVAELLDLIATWNRARMKVLLEAGIDLFIKRAWYENCDNFTPRHFRRFIRPILAADAELAHQHGVKFGIMMTSNCMPLLDDIREAGVDAVIGVDPAQWDLEVAKEKLGGVVCLWGGVNGHLTVEMGKTEAVQAEVRRAMQVLAPGGGFVLSPVDNVREYTPTAQANVAALLAEWKRLTAQ
jgi:uroporphyrinogen decarboxylase